MQAAEESIGSFYQLEYGASNGACFGDNALKQVLSPFKKESAFQITLMGKGGKLPLYSIAETWRFHISSCLQAVSVVLVGRRGNPWRVSCTVQ